MKMKVLEYTLTIFVIAAFLSVLAYADDGNTTTANDTIQNLTDGNISDGDSGGNDDTDIPDVEPPEEEITDYRILNLTPTSVSEGEVFFTILINNVGNTAIKELIPLVSGDGFATYNIIKAKNILPGEVGEAYVRGDIKGSGTVRLTVQVGDRTLYQDIQIESTEPVVDLEKEKELERQREEAERQKNATLNSLKEQLSELRANYTSLEEEINAKKSDYDVSQAKLSELKQYLTDAQSALIDRDPVTANKKLNLATIEFQDQRRKLDEAKKIPLINKVKDNIIVISAIAASLMTLFGLYEIIKKKQEKVYTKIKEVKVGESSKKIIEIFRKKPGAKGTTEVQQQTSEPASEKKQEEIKQEEKKIEAEEKKMDAAEKEMDKAEKKLEEEKKEAEKGEEKPKKKHAKRKKKD